MRFSAVAAALLPVGVAFAQTTHVVQVGGNASLTYTPNQLTGVANGDVIQFQFLDKNHTVTQSTFAAPCSNITDATGAVTGVDSGYQFVDPAATSFPVWQITINNASTPLWFYCRQAKHCQAGMVFAVNPTAEKTFDAFKTNAAASTSVNGSPAAAAGNTTSSTPASGSSAAAAPSGTGAAVGTGATSGSTPSPSASGTSGAGNGAGSLQFTSGAALLSLAGLSLGLLL
ncbi:hypothetical protein L226DRAFT_567040 [Lentinus tigrinus ALCF2SS1-7]|uniref:Cupredoxin n=1 Tax=Lentinus tigrinus ALCF2SS1-6 TaxID=1328759 RepID=A0A5C2SSH6_9APHY|nr:hypothetical protein L227DRAFT_649322 [Lentinus tigrinus ALCF2SS1-6]RPD80581.1 hypothetical protein L226DRAFT_567040 [Lentinus tigrinus ALCF2SS1-7]